MNDNFKKNIFTKRNIIIFIAIIVILILLIYFLFLRKSYSNVLRCSVSVDDYSLADVSMDINAYYTDKLYKIDGQINLNITDQESKNKISEIEQRMKKIYKDSDSTTFKVYRDGYNIIISYNVDLENIDEEGLNFLSLAHISEEDVNITIDEFEQQVKDIGGTCKR